MKIISMEEAKLSGDYGAYSVLLRMDEHVHFLNGPAGPIEISFIALDYLVDIVMFIGVQYDV